MDWFILLLGAVAFVAIFIIQEYGENDTKNITSKFDVEKEDINSNDSEDPIYPSRIVIRPFPVWGSFLCVLAVVAGFDMAAQEICRIFGWKIDNIVSYAIALVAGTFFTSVLNTKFVFDNDGITVDGNLYVLFFRVRNETLLIPWGQIYYVDFNYEYHRGIPSAVFVFIAPKRTISVPRGKHQESLAFAVEKLPASKFRMAARNRLEEMGLWGLCHHEEKAYSASDRCEIEAYVVSEKQQELKLMYETMLKEEEEEMLEKEERAMLEEEAALRNEWKKIAKKMKAKGKGINEIVEFTGLTADEILKL